MLWDKAKEVSRGRSSSLVLTEARGGSARADEGLNLFLQATVWNDSMDVKRQQGSYCQPLFFGEQTEELRPGSTGDGEIEAGGCEESQTSAALGHARALPDRLRESRRGRNAASRKQNLPHPRPHSRKAIRAMKDVTNAKLLTHRPARDSAPPLDLLVVAETKPRMAIATPRPLKARRQTSMRMAPERDPNAAAEITGMTDATKTTAPRIAEASPSSTATLCSGAGTEEVGPPAPDTSSHSKTSGSG